MLKFLGFIALIAIIFGVSFGTALAGFMKFVVIGIGILLAIWIILKMIESKAGAKFVLGASLIAIGLGVVMINDQAYSGRIDSCDPLISYATAHADCMISAMESHNDSVNKGWGYAICGTLAGLLSIEKIYDDKPKTASKFKKH